MNKKTKKILITGGNGFIARHLVEQLGGQYEISAPNSKELNLLDYSKVSAHLKNNKFDVVIHAATYDAAPIHSTNEPAKVFENNLKMFFNLVQCKDCFGKLIYFGSGAEYGREYWTSKMKEDYLGQHMPTDQYGLSKFVMAKYAESSSNIYNLRLFAVFGKYEDWRVRIISNICRHAALNLPITINQNKYFDFLYINDLVRIVNWFIDNKPQKNVYNICSGNILDFKTIAKKVVRISGKKLDVLTKKEDLGREYSGDNTLLMKELKEFSFTPIDESLRALYDWYNVNKNIESYNPINRIVSEDLDFILKSDVDWNKFRNKTVLITGAYGMLMSYLTYTLLRLNELDPKFNVVVIALVRDKEKARRVFGNLTENVYLKLYRHDLLSPINIAEDVDYIFHGASYASPHYFRTKPVAVLTPNILGTHHLLELAKAKKSKGFLFFSSGAVYGRNIKEVVTEKDYGYLDPLDMVSCYSESKRMGENMCKCWHDQFGLPVKVVRPAHIYGPTMDIKSDSRIVANFVKNIVQGQNLLMKSDGSAYRSFCYIADAAVAFLKVLLDGVDGEAYNVGNDDAYVSIEKLAAIFVSAFPEKQLQVIVKKEGGKGNKMLMSSQKVENLGWQCSFPILAGIKRTVKSFLLK